MGTPDIWAHTRLHSKTAWDIWAELEKIETPEWIKNNRFYSYDKGQICALLRQRHPNHPWLRPTTKKTRAWFMNLDDLREVAKQLGIDPKYARMTLIQRMFDLQPDHSIFDLDARFNQGDVEQDMSQALSDIRRKWQSNENALKIRVAKIPSKTRDWLKSNMLGCFPISLVGPNVIETINWENLEQVDLLFRVLVQEREHYSEAAKEIQLEQDLRQCGDDWDDDIADIIQQ